MDSSLRDYGIAAPHGPNMEDRHVATQDVHDLSKNEEDIFKYLLRPDDMYDENGTYWADMKIADRTRFILKANLKENKRELSILGRMFKRDPLSPVGAYLRNMVIPGAGLLLEGYVLFSIGNVRPLLNATFPDCWKNHTTCDKTWTQALEYLEILGIIIGQISVGIIGDWIGRRWGLIQDAIIMFVGLLMLTAAWGVTQNGWVICYAWSLFFYSVGVGGEYPMTATSGMENAVGAGRVSTKEDRLHRGRRVTSAFLMQGWGQFLNQVLLILLLLIFHHGSGNPPYSKVSAQWTYRVSFAVPAVGTLWLVYYRTYKMRSASKQLALAKKRSNVTGYDSKSLKMTFTIFGSRILATAGTWFANDVFFYGNKLFQSRFIDVLTPGNQSVMVTWLWNLLNVGVSLCGYYLASFMIDNKIYGRKMMMQVGFFADFILFVIPAFQYEYFTSPQGIRAFQAMYFLSSFFNQFGPNSVTFLVAAEVYPTPIRASAHGFSAAVGKLGALLAAVLYNYITAQQIFYIVPWFGLAGAVLTFFFLPDTTGLDLKEQERRWHYIINGRDHEYHGIAVHPKHLSVWERMRGVGKNYNPELDFAAKINEMRGEWEEAEVAKHGEKKGDEVAEDHDEYSDEVSRYFTRTRGKQSPLMMGKEKRESSSGSDEINESEKR